MSQNEFLKNAAEWFYTVKAPDLKEKVNSGLLCIDSGKALESNYKKLFGFILFDYSMHKGPLFFLEAEEVAKEIGVTDELLEYAQDWINYSRKAKQNIQP